MFFQYTNDGIKVTIGPIASIASLERIIDDLYEYAEHYTFDSSFTFLPI